jgi:hypothetical protein
VEPKSQVELPADVTDPFEVFVNGVAQRPGVDYRRLGQQLLFDRELAGEGQLGFWRWTSIIFGVAGTYRNNDKVDVVYASGGRRTVVTLEPESTNAS